MGKKASILIVDDAASNIDTLGEILKDYDIKVAKNGEKALEIAMGSETPDLILLDIIMPGMDGYDVCKVLKQNKKTSCIPVIFITVRGEEGDELKGFACGAVDYISKPFSNATVRARVDTHLELKRHKDHLAAIIQEKTDALIHNERLAALGVISAVISHEINNPLAGIIQNVQVLKHRLSPDIENNVNIAADSGTTIHALTDYLNKRGINEIIDNIYHSGMRGHGIIEDLLSFSRVDQSGFKLCSPEMLIEQSIKLTLHDSLLNNKHDLNRIKFKTENLSAIQEIKCNPDRLKQVFHNIFKNAIQAMKEQVDTDKEPCICVKLSSFADRIRFEIQDNGPGMSDELKKNVFKPFFSTRLNRKGTGLGCFLSYIIIEKNHKGTIKVESQVGKGTTFIIEVPV